ncbi:ankyrin repeat-containing protein At5g02620-like [Cucurbita pepo subsp. pepo]|uniref:ankyrin repeat-containing protein At5g02620-like n=1 Tax=Cucurbita pepo subsp. pepo TaxID=3664 RepID=UPI000C9D38E7|nr:ankyrin repeat-containing protein At5g02620-like [Cucurbita pepo subsp. pepo]
MSLYMTNLISRRLYEAAHNGDVNPLQDISDRYPLLLMGGTLLDDPYDLLPEPPLQVAASFGHFDFVVRVLELEPASAHHSDRQGLSALHMAAANGHLNIITHLLQFDSELCFLCSNDGRNPMHFAAMNGRLQALRLLVGGIEGRYDVKTFLNAKDDLGFTLLHLAVYNQHLEIVQYLLGLEIEVNALSSKGLTPLDLLIDCPMVYPKRVRTANFLRGHGAVRSSALSSTTSQEIWARKKDTLMVVASLIATMAFQAVINPPGGVWQEDGAHINNSSVVSSPQVAGKSVMAAKSPKLYVFFITFASWAFIFSLMELLLHVSNRVSNSGMVSEALIVYAKYMSTLSLLATYSISAAFLTALSGQDAAGFTFLMSITAIFVLLYLFFVLRYGFRKRPSPLKKPITFPPPIPPQS